MNRPAKPKDIRIRIHDLAAQANSAPDVTRGHAGAITGALNKLCGSDFERHRLLYYLFPNTWPTLMNVTSKSLKGWHWYALYKWTDVHKDEELKKWVYHPDLPAEIDTILVLDIETEALLAFEPPALRPEKSWQERDDENMAALGFATRSVEPETRPAHDPTISMPKMECGHEADMYSAAGMPYCGACAKIEGERGAYQVDKSAS